MNELRNINIVNNIYIYIVMQHFFLQQHVHKCFIYVIKQQILFFLFIKEEKKHNVRYTTEKAV